MLAALSTGTQAPAPSRAASDACHCSRSRAAVLAAAPGSSARRRARMAPRVQAFGAAAVLTSDNGMQQAQQLAQGLGVALGALAVGFQLMQEEQATESQHDVECPTCNGSGRVECACNRWSDGDAGCGSCGGTGMSACHSCGGGGRGVRLTAKAHKIKSPPRQ